MHPDQCTAVLAPDQKTQNLLTYGCLVIQEAQHHSGHGWLEDDKIFRQQAALSPSTAWNELNQSLHTSTVLLYRAGPGWVCSLCHEPDHTASTCALLALNPHASPPLQNQPAAVPGLSRRPQQETLEHICVFWNRDHCTFPSCKFCHICAVCKEKGHWAKDCQIDSAYKVSQSAPSKDPPESSGLQGTE